MSKSRLYAGSAALMFLFSGAAAFAVPGVLYMHRANSSEIAASNAGPGSLNNAISAIENVTGGRVIAIHFETGNGAGNYDATVARNGTVDHAIVDLATKKVAVLDQAQGPARTFDFRQRADAEVVVNSSKVALSDAVSRAEQESGGVAVSAETKRSANGGITVHDIQTVRNDAVRAVLVDAKNGLVIEDPQTLVNGR